MYVRARDLKWFCIFYDVYIGIDTLNMICKLHFIFISLYSMYAKTQARFRVSDFHTKNQQYTYNMMSRSFISSTLNLIYFIFIYLSIEIDG